MRQLFTFNYHILRTLHTKIGRVKYSDFEHPMSDRKNYGRIPRLEFSPFSYFWLQNIISVTMNKGSHIANCLANSDLFLLRNKYDSLSQRSAVFVACEGGRNDESHISPTASEQEVNAAIRIIRTTLEWRKHLRPRMCFQCENNTCRS